MSGGQVWKGKFEKDRMALVFPTQTDHMEKSSEAVYLNMFYGFKQHIKFSICSWELQLHFQYSNFTLKASK